MFSLASILNNDGYHSSLIHFNGMFAPQRPLPCFEKIFSLGASTCAQILTKFAS